MHLHLLESGKSFGVLFRTMPETHVITWLISWVPTRTISCHCLLPLPEQAEIWKSICNRLFQSLRVKLRKRSGDCVYHQGPLISDAAEIRTNYYSLMNLIYTICLLWLKVNTYQWQVSRSRKYKVTFLYLLHTPRSKNQMWSKQKRLRFYTTLCR